jgi:hypothetical protein
VNENDLHRVELAAVIEVEGEHVTMYGVGMSDEDAWRIVVGYVQAMSQQDQTRQ